MQRYSNPLTGLLDNWITKTILAVLGSLFASDPQLVALVVILVIMDFLTGVYAARVRKEGLSSKGFRQTVVKSVEYTFLLLGTTAVANSFEVVNWIDEIAYLFVALTELKSVVENITSSESAARKIWLMVRREINRKGDVVFDPEQTGDENYIISAPKYGGFGDPSTAGGSPAGPADIHEEGMGPGPLTHPTHESLIP